MELTPEELRALRDVAHRAVDQAYEILVSASRRAASERGAEEPRREVRRAVEAAAPGVPEMRKLSYTVKEAGAASGLSRSTLYGMIADGRLATIRLGGRRLIEAAAIEALLEEARAAAGTAGERG
jgi:excisionase family DNA binding protein